MYLYIIPNAFIPQYSFCILNCIVTHVSVRHVYITVFWNITVYWKCWCLLCVIIFHDVLLHLPAFSTYNLYIILSFIFCFCRYDKHAIWILYIYISHTHTYIYICIYICYTCNAAFKTQSGRKVKAHVPTWPSERFGDFTVAELLQHTSWGAKRWDGGTGWPGDLRFHSGTWMKIMGNQRKIIGKSMGKLEENHGKIMRKSLEI